MNAPEDRDEGSVVTAFLVELLHDLARGVHKPLDDYQARYPGYEAAIAREFASFPDAAAAEPTAAPPSSPVPDTWSLPAGDRYRVDGEIGRGGMGVVFKVWEHRLHRHLALKRVRAAGASPQDLARFLEEARVTAQLHHPGIVPVHELGMDAQGRLYFTMDMVRGRTFAEMIAGAHRGGEEWNRALEVLQRVCEAVAYAHSKDVVHRDLKPHNVMVGRFGEVYVMDWGLARVANAEAAAAPTTATDGAAADSMVFSARQEADTPQWTLQGDVVGTPAYMAPEQARGSPDVDRRVDLYAIGAMLYHLLAGRMPYGEGDPEPSSRAILERVAAGPPRPLAQLHPDAPAELVAVCNKAMARTAADRYADVLELRDELRAFVERRVVHAYESGTWAELRKWVRRNRTVTAAAALAVLALSVGLVVSLLQSARAIAETTKANASFDDAMAAVNRMLTVVGQHTLVNVPQAAPIRRQLLQDAVDFFEKFLAKRGDDPTVRRRAGSASYRAAALHELLGDRDAAAVAIRRALELWQAELEEAPHDRELRHDVAMAQDQMATQAMRRGDNERAGALYGQALAGANALLAEDRDKDNLELTGVVLGNYGILAYRSLRFDEALRLGNEAVACRRELVDRFGDEHLEKFARAHNLLGAVLRRKRDLTGACREFQAAVDIHERLAEARPDDVALRHARGMALGSLATALHELRDHAASDATVEQEIALGRANVGAMPGIPTYEAHLGVALSNRALFQRDQGHLEVAWLSAVEGLDFLRAALAKDADNRVFASSLLLSHRQYHLSALALGRYRDMAANAQTMGTAPQAEPSWIREAAHQLVRCLPLVARDDALDEAQRAARTEEYLVGALEFLQAAALRGGLTAKNLEHKDFAPLRNRDGFRALVEKVGAGGPR